MPLGTVPTKASASSPDQVIPSYWSPSTDDDPAGVFQGILAAIGSARTSIDGAVHEIDLMPYAEAFCARRRAGVRVRLVVEERWTRRPAEAICLAKLRAAGVELHPLRGPGLMHHKFLVLDGARVFTGSANFTARGAFRNANACVLLRSPGLAAEFTAEWNRLRDPRYRAACRSAGFWHPLFGDEEREGDRDRATRRGVGRARVFFAGESPDPVDALELAVRAARSNADFAIFSFSDGRLARAFVEAAERGVRVRGIFDDAFESEAALRAWKAVPFQMLWMAGADVRYDADPAKVHHKWLAVDGTRVLGGSANWSAGGAKRNRDHVVEIEAPALAARFSERLRSLAASRPEGTDYELWTIASRRGLTTLSFPSWQAMREEALRQRVEGAFRSGAPTAASVVGVDGPTALRVRIVAGLGGRDEVEIPITLAGLAPPMDGARGAGGEPWTDWAGQASLRILAGRRLRLLALSTSVLPFPCLASFADASVPEVDGVQRGLVGTGLFRVPPDWREAEARLGRGALAEALAAWDEVSAPRRPPGLAAPWEDLARRQARLAEARSRLDEEALPAYRAGALAGDLRTRRVFQPGTPGWARLCRGGRGVEAAFFAAVTNAHRAGFTLADGSEDGEED